MGHATSTAGTARLFPARPALVLVLLAAVTAARADDPPDALQRAVVESLAFPPRNTPPALIDAAIRAAEVDAEDVALGYVARFVASVEAAGEAKADLLADIGDAFDPAALSRLERLLAAREPAVRQVVNAITAATRDRRRDPARLARAVADLTSEARDVRQAAATALSRAREEALPELVGLLETDDPAGAYRRAVARGLVADLGADARQPLLEWLASDDVEHWDGVIEALEACDAADVETFLLAPALVSETPAPARAAALAALRRRALARGDARAAAAPPSRDQAVARIARRLDKVLSPGGLPAVDHLMLAPIGDPRRAADALGGSLTGTVERFVREPESGRLRRLDLSPRAARSQEAMHLARDLVALGADDVAHAQLALLARLEELLVLAGEPAPGDRIPPSRLREAISPPGGFDIDTAATILEEAVTRGMWEAAAATAAALEPPEESGPSDTVLPPAARKALVRALAVPDADVQFAAARTLALAAGDPPYPGSSRVAEVLLHAATSAGVDRVIVCHPDVATGAEIAAGISRFGYAPIRVETGRDAILAARESADTVLVMLGARTARPTVLETVQFLQQQGLDGVAPVLVMVDPLDDDGRGCFLERLTLRLADLDGVAIVDSLDSFLGDAVDPPPAAPRPPRFPDALAQVAGPAAVDPVARATRAARRLARGREALGLLAHLGRRGWDVSAAARSARAALDVEALRAPAVSLLATIGAAEAQQALRREAEEPSRPAAARRVALASLRASVNRYGLLFESRDLLDAYARYNRAGDAGVRASAEAVLDLIERPCRDTPAPPVDAPPARSTR